MQIWTNDMNRPIQFSTLRQGIQLMFQMMEESRSQLQEPWVVP